jgi:hypothetical protein
MIENRFHFFSTQLDYTPFRRFASGLTHRLNELLISDVKSFLQLKFASFEGEVEYFLSFTSEIPISDKLIA